MSESKTVWIPEVPAGVMAGPWYRSKEPVLTQPGNVPSFITTDVNDALQFDTQEDCIRWIAAHPHPRFQAIEHMFVNGPVQE